MVAPTTVSATTSQDISALCIYLPRHGNTYTLRRCPVRAQGTCLRVPGGAFPHTAPLSLPGVGSALRKLVTPCESFRVGEFHHTVRGVQGVPTKIRWQPYYRGRKGAWR